jgi:hypothetical protein
MTGEGAGDGTYAEHESTALACARLADSLRVSGAPAGVLAAARGLIEQAHALLRPHEVAGPHSQSERGVDPEVFFARGLHEPHRVMPYSPIIGPLNPVSARLVFEAEGERLVGHGSIPVRYVGAPQTAHGGYVAAVLDELMGLVNFLNGEGAYTGTMTVRYHRPTPIETGLVLGAQMLGREGRKIRSHAEIRCAGEITASAEGLFIRPR